MAKVDKKKLHSKTGWKYKKINKIVEQIHNIFDDEKITFVEEIAILSWFQAEIVYNMSKYGAKDFVQEHIKMPEQPSKNDVSYIG